MPRKSGAGVRKKAAAAAPPPPPPAAPASDPSSPTAFSITVARRPAAPIKLPEETLDEEEKGDKNFLDGYNDAMMAEAVKGEGEAQTAEDAKEGEEEKLEEEEEEEEEDPIVPDHYWADGKIPVFKPTMDQFRSFKDFVEKIDHYGMKSGIVKIIPPKEWTDSLPNLEEKVKEIRVKNPIEQHIAGMTGTYRQTNLEKQKTYNLPQWRKVCESSDHQPPARRGERRRNQEAKPAKDAQSRQTRASRRSSAAATELKKIEDEKSANPPTPPSPSKDAEDVATPEKEVGGRMLRTRKKYPRKTKEEMDHALERDALWDGFDYHLDNVDEFTPERCEELEKAYWRTLTYNSPLYGADMPGSLFDETTTSWNVAKLENILDCLGKKLPGVNTAYLYLGMWKSTFSWHLEDVDLYSINYIHFGAPKQWYSVSQEDLPKFEAIMKNIWQPEAKKCSQFLRHKTFLVSPSQLEQRGLKVNRLVHYEGEFVITFPYGYHSGYNLGYNCAESVNFATEAWLDYGRIAKKCECIDDAVWVDVDEIERKLKGLPTEDEWDDDEDEDDESMAGDLPTPPESIGEVAARVVRRRAPVPKKKKAKKEKAEVKVKLKLNAPREPCVLCPNDLSCEPVLKTDSGREAHRLCAIYTPETYFGVDQKTEEEVICNIEGIPRARLQLKCYYCRSKKGACFQCSEGKCVRAYHATCAASAGVLVDMRDVAVVDANGDTTVQTEVDFKCRFHRPKRNRDWDGTKLEGVPSLKTYGKTLLKGDLIQVQFFRGDIFAGIVQENRYDEETVVIDVVPSGGLIEVEWKWILATEAVLSNWSTDPNPVPVMYSTGPKLGALDQPRAGDKFHLSSTIHTWAEFNTGPATVPATATNFKQEGVKKYWYYIPEISTDYIPKYSDDPSSNVPNEEANLVPTKRVKYTQIQDYDKSAAKSSPLSTLTATAAAAMFVTPTPTKMPTHAIHTSNWQSNTTVTGGSQMQWSHYEPTNALPWLTPQQLASTISVPNTAPAALPQTSETPQMNGIKHWTPNPSTPTQGAAPSAKDIAGPPSPNIQIPAQSMADLTPIDPAIAAAS